MARKDRLIIGITGPAGSGKGVIVEYLLKKGFTHFSVRGYITEEIIKRGMTINRESMVIVGNDLRKKYGSSYIVDELYKRAEKLKKDAIIESIRTLGEAESLRNKGKFILLSIDADIKERYERIKKRASSTDNISFEDFKKQEEVEYSNPDVNKQNISACMKVSDYTIKNDSTKEELYLKIDELLLKIDKEKNN
jgi:dephospho-CoA kinase